MTAAPSAATVVTRRQTSRSTWRPALLAEPDGLLRTRYAWEPALLKPIDTLTVLIVFLALQFLIPARLVIGGMGAVGRPTVAIGILLVFVWALSAVRGQLPGARQPIRWVIFLYVAVQMFSYAVGFDRGLPGVEASSADRWIIFTIAMAGLTLAIADGIPTRAQLDRFLLVLVGFTTVMAVIGILQFLGVADLTRYLRLPGLSNNAELIGIGQRGGPGFARVASTATHYIEFGVVLSMVLPVALHYALFATERKQRQLRWAAVVLIASAIPFSLSRSATLAVTLGMAVLATVWPWRQRYNAAIIGVVATAAFAVVQPGVLGTIRSLFSNADDDPSIQNRIARTDYVMDLWSLRPWFGRGAGTVIPEQYILLDNQLYVTLLAGGVVGLAGLVIFLLGPYFIARSIRLRGADQETRHLAQSLAVIMPVSLLVSATFDSFSFATFVGVLFLVIGAIGALWRLDHESPHERVLQIAAPGDKYVATPLMAYWRRSGPTDDGVRTPAAPSSP
ncbi:O-antigen ligase family protein [Jiangella asiatica]|uniref:O-antigen ligase domain-containing protein n=1 Tax=Jiangella asiatica TaxID=2530372 RepID=A0A4R5DB72_9ACTN|nr:O-antigen ligase family protein [Jiangella asiatica]TDE07493.1 O-antigen ligase domain-containing protein [Jiangella asiatica]